MDTPADRLPGADEDNLAAASDGLTAEVPAGAAGADSGAVGTARVDSDDEARVQGVSSQNDIPGVGTRAADGSSESGTDAARGGNGSTSLHTEDTGRPGHGGADPADETVRTPASPPLAEGAKPHVDSDDPIAAFQPGVGRDSAASSKIAQSLPDPDDA